MSFPPLTWVRCECGCGFEGIDPVAEYLLEEALLEMLEAAKLVALEGEAAEARKQQAIAQARELVDRELGR